MKNFSSCQKIKWGQTNFLQTFFQGSKQDFVMYRQDISSCSNWRFSRNKFTFCGKTNFYLDHLQKKEHKVSKICIQIRRPCKYFYQAQQNKIKVPMGSLISNNKFFNVIYVQWNIVIENL